jgi:tetratricopeptide (TPR) repeat protein
LFLVWTSSVASDSAREYFKFAKFSYDSREYSKALEFINSAIAIDQDYTSSLILRAQIYKELSNYNAMIADASRVIELSNQSISISAQAHLLRGMAYFHVGNFQMALSDLNQSQALNPEDDLVYFYKGLICRENRKLFFALEEFDQAIKYNTENYKYFYFRAITKKENYRPIPNTPVFDNIMEDIDRSINLNPDDYQVYKLRCDMLKLNMANEREVYLDELTQTIERFPEQSDFYAQRGMARILDYKFSDALSDLDQAIAMGGSDELILRNRALCYHNLSNYSAALQDYSSSIDLMINKFQKDQEKNSKLVLAETLVLRGRTLQQTGNPDDACTDFYNAAKLGSKTGLNIYRRSCNVFN